MSFPNDQKVPEAQVKTQNDIAAILNAMETYGQVAQTVVLGWRDELTQWVQGYLVGGAVPPYPCDEATVTPAVHTAIGNYIAFKGGKPHKTHHA